MRCFVEGNLMEGGQYFLDTMTISLGIAAGVVGVAIGWGMISDTVKKYKKRLLERKEK